MIALRFPSAGAGDVCAGPGRTRTERERFALDSVNWIVRGLMADGYTLEAALKEAGVKHGG